MNSLAMAFNDVFKLLQKAWNLYKRYAGDKHLTETQLDTFAKEVDDLYREYNSNFAKDILTALVLEVERGLTLK